MDKARQICLEMLEQREYDIKINEEDKLIAIKPDGNQMIVFFSDISKFNVKNIQVYINIMSELSIFHSIIIYKDGVTSFTKKTIDQSVEMKFELFAVEDLQYNITKHRLQPKFEKLNNDETVNFKAKYGLKIPTLRRDDPIALFYSYEKGDIIKITRNATGISFITYRLVKG